MVGFQLDDRAGIALGFAGADLHQRHLFAGHHTAARNGADLAGHPHIGGVLVGAGEFGVFSQLGHLFGVNKDHLFGGLLFLQGVHRIHNARIADDARRAVIGQGGGLQHIHAVVVDLGGNGHGQLGVGLPHRVAITGKHRFIGQANAFHSLFHGGLAGGGRHLFNGHGLTLGHNVGIADIGIGGHRDGIAGDTGQGIIHLGKGRHAQLFWDAGGHHVPHYFRVDQISNFGISICHRISPLSNQFLQFYCSRLFFPQAAVGIGVAVL